MDLIDAGVSFAGREILRHIDWRIGPGERAGVLGVNGAGKSTLLGLIAGSVRPTSGRVKHGALVDAELLARVYVELTGGRQIGLDLATDEAADVLDIPVPVVREGRTPRAHGPSEAELQAHAGFVAGLKAPLWQD